MLNLFVASFNLFKSCKKNCFFKYLLNDKYLVDNIFRNVLISLAKKILEKKNPRTLYYWRIKFIWITIKKLLEKNKIIIYQATYPFLPKSILIIQTLRMYNILKTTIQMIK